MGRSGRVRGIGRCQRSIGGICWGSGAFNCGTRLSIDTSSGTGGKQVSEGHRGLGMILQCFAIKTAVARAA